MKQLIQTTDQIAKSAPKRHLSYKQLFYVFDWAGNLINLHGFETVEAGFDWICKHFPESDHGEYVVDSWRGL